MATQSAPVTQPPKRRRKPATVRDMVLSLIVVGAAIGVFVLLLPKSPHQKVTAVAFLPAARALAAQGTLPVYAPDPPPAGWQANYVRIDNAPDEMHIGFVLDAKRFARLDESARPGAAFYQDARVSPQPTGGQQVAGFSVRRSGSHVAFVRELPGGGVVVVSDGGSASSATYAEVLALAESLRQQKG